nr:hypothetical protein [Morganella morganii]
MKEHEIQYILYQIINKAADIPQYNIRRNVSTDTDISLSDY